MHARPILRIAPWLILMVAAYAVGRWQARPPPEVVASSTGDAMSGSDDGAMAPKLETTELGDTPAATETSRGERLVAELDSIAIAAKSIPVPDSRSYAFFENLELADLGPVFGYIEAMVPGNEQDVLFVMGIRRWAELDGPAALARANRFPALGVRTSARLAAYEAWASKDPRAAFEKASAEEDSEARGRAMTSSLVGASINDPRVAVELWLAAPDSFRESEGGASAAAQIASAAFGTGKAETIRAIVQELPEGALRSQLVESLATDWGAHYPDEAFAWVQKAIPEGEARDAAVNGLFSSLVQKDPALAALWASQYPDEGRRTSYIAAAVQNWARLDTLAAETWVNEQPSGRYLDGAGYAMAAHFMARRNMRQSFSWIRRINWIEMRAELMGTLGRMWAAESPEGFRQFLDETSLNRAEVEMLLSKIPPAS